jgi:hypothetical protein
MQTFMPYADFAQVASVLDNQRLNKQALEGWQIMLCNLRLDPQGNHRQPRGWFNHPAVKLWRGHESALLNYIGAMVDEWKHRGFKSTIYDKAEQTYETALLLNLVSDEQPAPLPHWMLDSVRLDVLMASHRTALLCKNYDWYHQFGWSEDNGVAPTEYNYVWFNASEESDTK